MSRYRFVKPAEGRPAPNQGIRVQVRFDAETFDEIREQASEHRRSLSEQIRLLTEWGLEIATGTAP